MIVRFSVRLLVLLLGANLTFCSFTPAAFADVLPASTDQSAAVEKATAIPAFRPLSPGPFDGRIAWVTASLLEQSHYTRQHLDRNVSSKFFERYMDSLDPQHLHFLKSDLDQFEKYRYSLGELTLLRQDVRPGTEIFNRFMERLEQRVSFVDLTLATEKFAFDRDEKIVISRKDQPYPKDLNEAKQLWRERLRFEYLQEKLSKMDAKKRLAKEKKSEKPATTPRKSEPEEIVDTLKHSYHRSLRNFTDWNSDDVLQTYLDALSHVYDPHSDYMGSAHLDSFAISMNLSLTGIGAELRSEDGYCTIQRLLPGGPAEKSKKVHVKDKIVAVAQGDKTPVDVVDMNLNKVVQMIRGTKGTEVRLTIVPEGGAASDSKVIALVRDQIPLEDSAAKAKIIELPDGAQNIRLGVIDLPSFYAQFEFGGRHEVASADDAAGGKSTSADVTRLLKKLKAENVQGVVLDLRRNGGGSLEEAVKLTGLFIKQGPVVQVRDFQGNTQSETDNDPSVVYDGPLIVLTSKFSASASEIVAAALQDYGRALVVGDSSTHGKGTVQSVTQLRPFMNIPEAQQKYLTNDPGALKLTIKKFYRASGVSTQLKGVTPDIVLPSVVSESKDFGETALDNPLPCDTIAPAKYEHLNLVSPFVAELKTRAERREAADKEFGYIREDIAWYKKQQADKTLSLNEKQRVQEKEELDAKAKARDKERMARKEPDQKVYELTLRLAEIGKPLPAPVVKTNSQHALVIRKNGSTEAATDSRSAAASPTTSVNSSGSETVKADPLTDEAADADEEKPPATDVSLLETEHILLDYLSLLHKRPEITQTQQQQAAR
jgi:carboxyl-terminal processing protease